MARTRRDVLVGGSVVLTTALTGCSFGQTEPSIFVTATNNTESHKYVAVVIGFEAETYFESMTRVAPGGGHTFEEGIFTPDADVRAPVRVFTNTGLTVKTEIELRPETEIEVRLSASGSIEIRVDETPDITRSN